MKITKILLINCLLTFASENMINETLLDNFQNNIPLNRNNIDKKLFIDEFIITEKISESNKKEFMEYVINLQEEKEKDIKYKEYIKLKKNFPFYFKLSTIVFAIIFSILNITNIISIKFNNFIYIIINLLSVLFSIITIYFVNFNFQKICTGKNIILFIASLLPFIIILITNILIQYNVSNINHDSYISSIMINILTPIFSITITLMNSITYFEIYDYEKNNI